MAVETERVEGFGHVSRRLDVAFQYLLLAATLFGIVMLGVLLLYVANDAFQPFTADTGWLVTYAATLFLPGLAVAIWLGTRRYPALVAGTTTLGIAAVGVLFAAGTAIVFLDIVPPLVWLSYVVAIAIPFAVTVVIHRIDRRVPYLVRVGVVAALLLGSLAVLPGTIQNLYVVPTAATIVLLSVSAPVAALLGSNATHRWESRRAGLVAGAVAFLLPAVGMVAGPLVGLNPLPAVLLATVAVVPTVGFVASVVVDRPAERIGLLLPAVVLVGGVVGWVVVHSAGFAGPHSWVNWHFLTSPHSGTAENAGFYPAIGGSIILMVIVAVISFPLGVGTAIYLEEYAPDNR